MQHAFPYSKIMMEVRNKSRLETYETIVGDHFPNSRNVTDADPIAVERRKKIALANKNPVDINDPKAAFIAVKAIEVALSSFHNRKAGSEDRHKPIMLKKIGRNSLIRICASFRASYLIGLL